MRNFIQKEILPRVQRPSRYLGTEWNAVHKDWERVAVKMAFIFPDLYEVGMSYLGLHILYGLVNSQPDFLLERVFAPAPDLEKLLRTHHLPLFSLESYRPMWEFDLLGFTLPYEMDYTNVLNLLDLAGLPLRTSARKEEEPLVAGGGICTVNPEPLAPFFDFFVLGEGEEVLLEVLTLLKEVKGGRKRVPRREFLQEAIKIPGIYVPSAYEVTYTFLGTIAQVTPKQKGAPAKVFRRVVKDLETAYFPTRPVVPFTEVIHDRAMLEIMRGCTRGCRFCQAGMLYRPVRERSLTTLQKQAEALIQATGYEEIALTSLSSTDYTTIQPLVNQLTSWLAAKGVNISLPSLRTDTFSVELAQAVQRVRRSGLTFAPEAGTQRLRNVINKGVTEADLLQTAAAAFQAGWRRIKLYFMIGLPTETFTDLDGIVELSRAVLALSRKYLGGKTGELELSVASFVPKPQTPFQWEAQDSLALLKEKQAYLQTKLRGRSLSCHAQEAELSFLEAAFARGDRNLAEVLETAWRKGCRFDSWREHFRFQTWQEAFSSCGCDPAFYASRPRTREEVFPWDHLDFGVKKAYLWEELEKARAGVTTPDCRTGCLNCGVCPALGVSLDLKGALGCG